MTVRGSVLSVAERCLATSQPAQPQRRGNLSSLVTETVREADGETGSNDQLARYRTAGVGVSLCDNPAAIAQKRTSVGRHRLVRARGLQGYARAHGGRPPMPERRFYALDQYRELIRAVDALDGAEQGLPHGDVALVVAADRVLRARIDVARALLKAGWRPDQHLLASIKADWDAASQSVGSAFLDPATPASEQTPA